MGSVGQRRRRRRRGRRHPFALLLLLPQRSCRGPPQRSQPKPPRSTPSSAPLQQLPSTTLFTATPGATSPKGLAALRQKSDGGPSFGRSAPPQPPQPRLPPLPAPPPPPTPRLPSVKRRFASSCCDASCRPLRHASQPSASVLAATSKQPCPAPRTPHAATAKQPHANARSTTPRRTKSRPTAPQSAHLQLANSDTQASANALAL